MAERTIYSASRIFTGDSWLTDHALVTNDGIIEEILPVASLAGNQKILKIESGFLAPAFIDLQIYGANGKLFSVYPETDALIRLVDYCRKGGASWCLPTVATNSKEVFIQCIDAIREYWRAGGKGVLGIHLEGPWINAVKRGAHIASLIHPPTVEEAREILEYGKGIIKMITLAPELCSKEVIDLILSYDIIIAAGHSNATYEEAVEGFEKGIATVTHLFNAMSPFQHRAPGLAGAAMDHDKVMSSIIPDGHHVDFAAIRVAKKVMKERLYAITDAVTETSEGPYPHVLAGDKYEAGGILSGSALTMQKALYNLVNHVGIELEEALRMCSLYPAKVAKMNLSGRIEAGFKADIVQLGEKLEVISLL